MRSPGLLCLAAAVALAACSKSSSRAVAPASPMVGIDVASIDTHANPCQDFYQYACGNWDAAHPIPDDQSEWGGFSVLADHNQAELHKILDDASVNTAKKDLVTQEVGDYYTACMDQAGIDAAGIKTLRSELDNIAGIADGDQLAAEVARLQLSGGDVMFGFGAGQDFKNANQVIAQFDQGGLGLPDRDYYTKTDAKSAALRQQYAAHVAKMFALLGDKPAQSAAEAATVLRIETALARASLTRVEERDPNTIYHKMSTAQIEALAPNFHWDTFLTGMGAPTFATANASDPAFLRALNTELKQVPLADWKTYLRWHLVHMDASALSQPFVDADFEFFGATLAGQKTQKPRWKRCVSSTDGHLGEALGQLYVEQYFSPQAKAHMEALVANLETSLGQDIQSLDWMTTATKQQALVKLHQIVNKIGYPDHWRDYSSITISRDNYLTDLRRTETFESRRELNEIGKPVDRSEYVMTPPTVNAYYTPLWNQIVFPAGILQPPFYNPNRDDASNYGAIGMVIGHEMTHGFDDSGARFDPQGNLRNWWTPADAKAFRERTACIVREYDAFSPVPGVHLNGQLTLGENTADNGGMRIAYTAMEAALAGKPDPNLDGFDREQRFFLANAQIWCENVRPAYSRLMANLDPHSPGRFRTIGIVTNMPEFAQAFHCGPTDPMSATAKSCRVW